MSRTDCHAMDYWLCPNSVVPTHHCSSSAFLGASSRSFRQGKANSLMHPVAQEDGTVNVYKISLALRSLAVWSSDEALTSVKPQVPLLQDLVTLIHTADAKEGVEALCNTSLAPWRFPARRYRAMYMMVKVPFHMSSCSFPGSQ